MHVINRLRILFCFIIESTLYIVHVFSKNNTHRINLLSPRPEWRFPPFSHSYFCHWEHGWDRFTLWGRITQKRESETCTKNFVTFDIPVQNNFICGKIVSGIILMIPSIQLFAFFSFENFHSHQIKISDSPTYMSHMTIRSENRIKSNKGSKNKFL